MTMKAYKRKKGSYQQRVFIYFFLAFLFFAVSVLGFQYRREKQYRLDQLEARLDNTARVSSSYIARYGLVESRNFSRMDSLVAFLPDRDIRITVIGLDGKVLYDSFVPDYEKMENHLQRPEVQKALFSETGGNKRHSATTGQDFYYYARNFDEYFVRCAAIYDVEIENFLKTGSFFFFFILALFVAMGIILYIVTSQLGYFINRLRDFAVRAGRQEKIDPDVEFADSEFGEIQNQIIQIYDNMKSAKDELTREKERLFNHLHALNEGIAFFTPDKKKILTNSHFIQHINVISSRSSISAEMFFEIGEFSDMISEVDKILESDTPITSRNLPQFEEVVQKNERYFRVQVIIFPDRSFEVLVSDISKPEKRRILKQQLTSNIAHELKTPLSSIKGYMETIANNDKLTREQTVYFAQKALSQGDRLNSLLNDMSLLHSIEQEGNLFEFGHIKIKKLVSDVVESMEPALKKNKSGVKVKIDSSVKVYGNDSLLSSVFQNLIDNSIKYGGEGVTITINHYLEDEKYHYFNYSDDGPGIAEKHLPRIFERFYRADEGRTRESGGTGLGLAIVKNAVHLHKGDISVRNRGDKGLEFFFSLAK